MNIAFFLIPKQNVAFLFDDFTLRQGLEKMRHHGYSAIPVINRENRYVGTVSEGDFLWYLVEDRRDGMLRKTSLKSIEDISVRDVLNEDKNPPVRITATVGELLNRAMTQNFIPVIDDRDLFIGIVTRSDIIKHCLKTAESSKSTAVNK